MRLVTRTCQDLILGLMEAVYPEFCAGCDACPLDQDWCSPGARVRGLRFYDAPHLCLQCAQRLSVAGPVHRTLELSGDDELPVLGAAHISEHLTRVVGALKYHTLRGVAWPLSEVLATAMMNSKPLPFSPDHLLLPVPLHRGRARSRGFNQAALLARLVAGHLGLGVAEDVARRVRSTAQQAQISDPEKRRRNLQGAFHAERPASPADTPLILVDDIITTGATAAALARTLLAAGWYVAGAVGVGVLEKGAGDIG